MKLIILLIVATAATAFTTEDPLHDQWKDFKNKFHKNYTKEEEPIREKIFYENYEFIMQHNEEADKGMHTFYCDINEYADMTNEEFRHRMNGYRPSDRIRGEPFTLGDDVENLPTRVDWRLKGYVTDIKNQAQCGSCWAFSTTGSVEGQHFKATGKLVSLSEQNLMDCSWPQGNMGCNGGLMDNAFKYIIENKGIDTEASYPYEAADGKCRFKRANVGATISSYVDVNSGSESSLQKAVALIGPISVAIDASQMSFQFYEKGVYIEPACSTTALDHGVLAVGYGSTKAGVDYWIVKNSWGKSWGQKGYIWMARNRSNQCGIATQASYPVV